MAGISQKEYNNQVDEALVLFGGGAPCCSIDPRLWGDFKELYKLKTGQDGAISVLRVRVKKAPLVLADMAGRSGTSMYSQGRFRTRPYEIDLFGRGIVTRTHRINQDNSDKFVERLNRSRSKLQGKASRYAWPALEKHTPTYTKNVDRLLNETIAVINRNLEK